MAPSLEYRIVIGIQAERITSPGPHAKWTPDLIHEIQEFLCNDEIFLQWKVKQTRVTVTTLVTLPLEGLREKIGAGGLQDTKNLDGLPILPILDVKIRRKVADIWNKLSKEDKERTWLGRRREISILATEPHDTSGNDISDCLAEHRNRKEEKTRVRLSKETVKRDDSAEKLAIIEERRRKRQLQSSRRSELSISTTDPPDNSGGDGSERLVEYREREEEKTSMRVMVMLGKQMAKLRDLKEELAAIQERRRKRQLNRALEAI